MAVNAFFVHFFGVCDALYHIFRRGWIDRSIVADVAVVAFTIVSDGSHYSRFESRPGV